MGQRIIGSEIGECCANVVEAGPGGLELYLCLQKFKVILLYLAGFGRTRGTQGDLVSKEQKSY